MVNEEIVMSAARLYTISLAVEGPDGRRFAHEWRMIPTGISGISLASFWMLLKASLEYGLSMTKVVAADFSRNARLNGLER